MKFQFKIAELTIMILSFVFSGVVIGSFLYTDKTSQSLLLFGGITFLSALTLLLGARVKKSKV